MTVPRILSKEATGSEEESTTPAAAMTDGPAVVPAAPAVDGLAVPTARVVGDPVVPAALAADDPAVPATRAVDDPAVPAALTVDGPVVPGARADDPAVPATAAAEEDPALPTAPATNGGPLACFPAAKAHAEVFVTVATDSGPTGILHLSENHLIAAVPPGRVMTKSPGRNGVPALAATNFPP